MIARLFSLVASLLVYVCVATVIAQAVVFTYVVARWHPNKARLVQALAIAQGVDLFAIKAEADAKLNPPSREQVSHKAITEARAANVRHLQIREQALQDALDQLEYRQNNLAEETAAYKQLHESFDAELLKMQEGAITEGTDNVRSKLESLKSKQAKELLVKMLGDGELDEVVTLLATMPTRKCAKIMGEFKTTEELDQLNEILQKIRNGYPDFGLAADMRKKLQSN